MCRLILGNSPPEILTNDEEYFDTLNLHKINYRIAIIDGKEKKMNTVYQIKGGTLEAPFLSPNGRYLLFYQSNCRHEIPNTDVAPEDKNGHIRKLNSLRMLDLEKNQMTIIHPGYEGIFGYRGVSFSPDSKYAVFSCRDKMNDLNRILKKPSSNKLYILDLKTQKKRLLNQNHVDLVTWSNGGFCVVQWLDHERLYYLDINYHVIS